MRYNRCYNLKMKNICIMNLLQCEIKKYNIENISDDNLLRYLHLLTNKYNDTNEKL